MLSHLFALGLVILFIWAGFWQLDRLDQKQDTNRTIEDRALVEPRPLREVLDGADPDSLVADSLDYVAVSVSGRFLDSETVRVANRSEDGRGGDWVVATFETTDGNVLLVNRGFLLRPEPTAPAPSEVVELEGWLRATRTKGWIGADDTGEGRRVPRLNVDDITERLMAEGDSGPVVPLWLQLETVDGTDPSLIERTTAPGDGLIAGEAVAATPRPIPLEGLDEGNHFGYAIQWFALAALSIVIYTLMLRRFSVRPT